nr:hypothetical protein [Tanacetum cinerariifolium]
MRRKRVQLLLSLDRLKVVGDTWIDPRDVSEEEALTTLEGVNTRGHLATALGEILALEAREQARAGVPEGASSST